MVLHDLLHRSARAPRLARHERVQEEVRLGVGRVLPNGPLPDHSPRLLRKWTPDARSRGLSEPDVNSCVKALKNMNGLTDLTLFDFLYIFFKRLLNSGLKEH